MNSLMIVIALIMTTVTSNGSGVSQTVTYHSDMDQCEAIKTYLEANNRVITPDRTKGYTLVKTGQCIEVSVPIATDDQPA